MSCSLSPEPLPLRDYLLHLVDADVKLRNLLALSGELFAGYHPRMRTRHEANARELELLLDDEGWPGIADVGEDGAEAAFLIALQSISRPAFQRRCLTLMRSAARRGEIPLRHPATLDDRIRVFEGRGQLYGTQMDWDGDGHLSPLPIEDEAQVDSRRAAVGLPPLTHALTTAQALAEAAEEHPPAEWLHCLHALDSFAREVGWR